MSKTSYDLVHSLPGRIRLRLTAIADNRPLADGLLALIEMQDGVIKASANTACASVTIEFEPGSFSPRAWFDQLQIEDIVPLAAKPAERKQRGPIMSALHRATFLFEDKLPPRVQFSLGTAALAATVIELPAVITVAILSASLLPIFNRALQTFLDERRLGADALDGASGIILIFERSFFPASVMVFLVGLGELIRDVLTMNCQNMIHHQLALSRRSAWLVSGKKRVRVPVEELKAGDRVVVYEGELIPFAGIILEGEGTVVPASPQMDFAPQFVAAGDLVVEDSILADGKLIVRYDQCLLSKPADPVLEKEKRRWLQRTKLHRQALRTGYRFVMPILSAAALLFLVTRSFHRAMAIIYFDFITGIKIAIPTAVLASMYKAGNMGVVMRNASSLEKLSEVDTVVFARSGALTALKPVVTDVFLAEGYSFEQVMRWAAALEQRYNHLGAFVLYQHAKLHTIPVPDRSSSTVLTGLGVQGHVEGCEILLGSTRLMELNKIDLAAAAPFLQTCLERGDSRICVAVDGKLAGVIAFQDPLREDAREAIKKLREIGIKNIVMITGGSQAAAEKLASQAGINRVHARALPEDKAEIIKHYRQAGRTVAVVGHDIDDALALEQADLAVALSSGSEIARHRADVVINSDSLGVLVDGVRLARRGMNLARENITLVSLPNWCGLALTAVAQADPLLATLLNNGSVVVGAANGLRPLLLD